MEFLFVCPETQKSFSSRHFQITEYQGVKTDTSGNKILDAKIVLTDPCPFCNKKHIYHSNELTCPFDGS